MEDTAFISYGGKSREINLGFIKQTYSLDKRNNYAAIISSKIILPHKFKIWQIRNATERLNDSHVLSMEHNRRQRNTLVK